MAPNYPTGISDCLGQGPSRRGWKVALTSNQPMGKTNPLHQLIQMEMWNNINICPEKGSKCAVVCVPHKRKKLGQDLNVWSAKWGCVLTLASECIISNHNSKTYKHHTGKSDGTIISFHHTPQYAFMAWCLVKHRDNFYL
jgi:hypothetical protein